MLPFYDRNLSHCCVWDMKNVPCISTIFLLNKKKSTLCNITVEIWIFHLVRLSLVFSSGMLYFFLTTIFFSNLSVLLLQKWSRPWRRWPSSTWSWPSRRGTCCPSPTRTWLAPGGRRGASSPPSSRRRSRRASTTSWKWYASTGRRWRRSSGTSVRTSLACWTNIWSRPRPRASPRSSTTKWRWGRLKIL